MCASPTHPLTHWSCKAPTTEPAIAMDGPRDLFENVIFGMNVFAVCGCNVCALVMMYVSCGVYVLYLNRYNCTREERHLREKKKKLDKASNVCFKREKRNSNMGFFLPTATPPASSASLLPIRRRSATAASLLHRLPPRFSRIPALSAFKAPTAGVVSSVASTSSTLIFVLAAGLLSLSGVRPLPARACAPPPTHQQQEIEGQDEQQQESEESSQQEEVEDKKVVIEEESKEDVLQQLESEEGNQQEEVEEEENKEDVLQQLEAVEEDEEVRKYSAILSGNPGDVDALKCLLYAKMRGADWGEALGYAQRLRDAEPGEMEWRLMVAQLHELNGDLDEAERQFREVLAEEPLNVRALHGLALCMQKKLEGPAVFEMLENALQLAISEKRVPEERNIKLLIAQMHVVMGQLDIAAEKLQNLINEDPRDFRSHLCQGIVDALSDRKEDADKQFDIYRSLVPDEFPDKSFINDVILAAKTATKGII